MPQHEFFAKYANLPLGERSKEISIIKHPGITPQYIYGTIKELDSQISIREATKKRLLEIAKLRWTSESQSPKTSTATTP